MPLQSLFRDDHNGDEGGSSSLVYDRPKESLASHNTVSEFETHKSEEHKVEVLFSTAVFAFKRLEGQTVHKKVCDQRCGIAVLSGRDQAPAQVVVYDTTKRPLCAFTVDENLKVVVQSESYVSLGDSWCFQVFAPGPVNHLCSCLVVCRGIYLRHNAGQLDRDCGIVLKPRKSEHPTCIEIKLWHVPEKAPCSFNFSTTDPGYIFRNAQKLPDGLDSFANFSKTFSEMVAGEMCLFSTFNMHSMEWMVAMIDYTHTKNEASSPREEIAEKQDAVVETTKEDQAIEEKIRKIEEDSDDGIDNNTGAVESENTTSTNPNDTILNKLDMLLNVFMDHNKHKTVDVIGGVVSMSENIKTLETENARLVEELEVLRKHPPVGKQVETEERFELLERCAEAKRLQLEAQEQAMDLSRQCLALRSDQLNSYPIDSIRQSMALVFESFELSADQQYSCDEVKQLLRMCFKQTIKTLKET
uniref:Uncharacterized protein n=1 Tax=Mucochytrium quahogii TaxID=96639 RepID=A0A7S2RSR6_9STRA|mmetsp:Transcript_39642/g.64291  ORF Transcript_39642/g.64291 Transcript_39642/m.64291 type:complete len:471 (-) Transcript_39642:2-1414(-)